MYKLKTHPAMPDTPAACHEPISASTAAYFAIAAAVVAAGATIYSTQQQAKAAKYNAALAEQDAKQAQEAAAYQEAQHRRNTYRALSAQRAAYAKAGVEINDGSPLEIAADTAREAEMDALAIRYSGSIQAARANAEAGLQRFQARSVQTGGYISAGGTLLGGAANYGRINPSSPKAPSAGPYAAGGVTAQGINYP
jgi:hypothetical protein